MGDEHSLDDPLLTGVFDELRSWGEGPAPVPNAALASLLAADDIRTAAAPLGPVPQSRRKRMLATKLAALGVAAKAALGVGVAVAAVTTAGATGVLPDAVQHTVAKAVETVTPLQLPDPTLSTTTTTLVGGHEADDDNDDDATTGAGGAAGQPQNHGACVSAVAKDDSLTGKDHGKAVSAIAKSDCGKENKGSTTTTVVGSTTTSTPSTTIAGGTANSGRGNGNSGNGNGNSGSAPGITGSTPANPGSNGNGNGNSGQGSSNSGRGNSSGS